MHIYIHIPFCESKCNYCDFNSYSNINYLKNSYINALLLQLKSDLTLVKPKSIKSVYFGGGTPSSIGHQKYIKIFEMLKPYLCDNTEINSEANPNSATQEWLDEMKELGVNRLSFGTQSFDNNKLKYLSRVHSANSTINAVNNAYKLGYKNLSVDLIYDVIGDNKKLLSNDLNIAFSLPINHISAYCLTIEGNIILTDKSKKHDDNLSLWFSNEIKKRFTQYEVSNYGDYKSIHNMSYWNLNEYLGIGSGAVGYINGKRYYPSKNVKEYIANPTNYRYETISEKELYIEKIFLGMRSCVGVPLKHFKPKHKERVNILLENGKLFLIKDKVYNKEYMLTDEIVNFII